MRLYRMEKYFFLFLLVITGCISPGVERKPAPPPVERKPAPPPEPTLPEKAYSETFQERAQKLRLQKTMDGWEDELNAVIDSLQAEIEKNKSIIEEGLLPEDQDYISKKNKTLFSYQEGLKRIKRLQQKLNERDTALSREIIYLHLIDRYLTSLKLVEKTREKKVSGGVDTKKIEEEIERIGEDKLKAHLNLFGWLFDESENNHKNHHYQQIRDAIERN